MSLKFSETTFTPPLLGKINFNLGNVVPLTVTEKLEYFYAHITKVFLVRQNPTTGLLPAAVIVSEHGDYNDAWVRDNVYSILAVWALSLAYRKIDDDTGKHYELEQSVVKLMRGVLFCMMRQAHKVELFKKSLSPLDCLHAKYNTKTGDTVVGDDQWGHLQLDATSLYLLQLAQMTASGLRIIFTQDEVDFVQNLVFYIERAYNTPDYGIWERGEKINHGNAELNASSVGMCKAALEAINGVNLFGAKGGPGSVIHAFDDTIVRNRTVLSSILPRESASKEVDAACLSIISYPAFAVEDKAVIERTKKEIVTKLQGRYGCKRFLRDGHQTTLEDRTRLHYEPRELKKFEHIECEWPVFYTYLFLDALFKRDRQAAAEYKARIERVLVEVNGEQLVPELFYVPHNLVDAEKANPHSQDRVPNGNVPLLWAQSLWITGLLIDEGLLAPNEIDPIGRFLTVGNPKLPTVQVALLSESQWVKKKLEKYGIPTQTPEDISPIEIRNASELNNAYGLLGANTKLGLTGRPNRPIGTLLASRIVKAQRSTSVLIPAFLNQNEFYITFDHLFLVDNLRSHISYVHHFWRADGRPTISLLIRRPMLSTKAATEAILGLLQELMGGVCGGVKVRVAKLQELSLTAAISRLDFIRKDFHFKRPCMSDSRRQSINPLRVERSASIIDVMTDPRMSALLKRESSITDMMNSVGLDDDDDFAESEKEEDMQTLQASKRLTPEEKAQIRTLDVNEITALFAQTLNLYMQIEILYVLSKTKGMDYLVPFVHCDIMSVKELTEMIFQKAGRLNIWSVVRQSAALGNKWPYSIAGAVSDMLIQGKEVEIGDVIITKPVPTEKICAICAEQASDPREGLLMQEILYYLGQFIKTHPNLFGGFLRLRVSYVLLVLSAETARKSNGSKTDGLEQLLEQRPFDIKNMIHRLLDAEERKTPMTISQRDLRSMLATPELSVSSPLKQKKKGNWLRRRQIEGCLSRVPGGFYDKVYTVLENCRGLSILDRVLDSSIVLDSTRNEKNFCLRIEHLLDVVKRPSVRQIVIEILAVLYGIVTVQGQTDNVIDLYYVLQKAVALWYADSGQNTTDLQCSGQFGDGPAGFAQDTADKNYIDPGQLDNFLDVNVPRTAQWITKSLNQCYGIFK
eukprot:TRINITY_DN5074_c0_g1_i2.p1 TRINITY_DN5074_c0_g1~~TRINITY_DN5074_c0_g1_i2.p1  ORF type:complete len:1142 (-),score=303.02 TRINITY_DN5074_c0_g1_i2:44-3469(-)